MRTLCQRDENNVCTQCGQSLPPGTHRSCTAKHGSIADREARGRRILADEWLRRELRAMNVAPCAFLGEPTGVLHKRSCMGGKDIAEHSCYHPARAVYLKRGKRFADGRCTPEGQCQDRALGIEACNRCPLRRQQLLLSAPN
jgi:hypothetical protein